MQTTTENNDLRSVLESSVEESIQENPAQVETSPDSGSPAAPVESYESSETTEPALTEEQKREYARDELGKFAPKDEKKGVKSNIQQNSVEKAPQEGIQAGPKANQPPAREWSTEKAPQAWKPEAREYWKDLPEPVRREVIRHAQVANDAISQNVEARRFAEAVQKTIAPFEHFIRAENSNPVEAINNLMSTAALLRTGTADQIAGLVAQITNQYGIGRFGNDFITRLDGALAGAAPAPVNPEVAAVKQQFEQELAPLRQMQQQMAYQQQLAAQQQEMAAQSEIEKFAQQAEFINDVRMEMADIIDMGAQRGVNYSLQQAYEIACRANPEISKVLQSREQSKSAQMLNQTAQKAKQAAVSVGGAPSIGGANQQAADLRSAIELAISNGTR